MAKLVDSEGNDILCNKDQIQTLIDAGVGTLKESSSSFGAIAASAASLLAHAALSELKEGMVDMDEEELQELYIAVANTGDSEKLAAVTAALDNPGAIEKKTVLDDEGNPIIPEKLKTVTDENANPVMPSDEVDEEEDIPADKKDKKKSVSEISEGTVSSMKRALPELTSGELVELLAKEKSGNKRQSAVDAIKAEIEERE